MSLGATDKQRSLFLKGFKLSKQGHYEDPTYLGFKVVIDFGVLPVNADDGLPPSPLFKEKNYFADNFTSRNPFGQAQYNHMTESNEGRVAFYSAQGYLEQREKDFQYGGKRSDMLKQFRIGFNDLLTNSPWFLQSISGLDALAKIPRPGYQSEAASVSGFSSQRTSGKVLTFNTLESLNLRVSALADLYNQATFDADNMRELLPRNLRKFTMYIFVSEIRNFFKTSRLIGSSAALTTIDNVATLLGSGNNPGSNLGAATDAANSQNQNFGSSNISPSSSFNSFVGNVINGAGLDNDFSLLKNQEDQSGIKPMIVFECKNCEFDFTDSTPVKNIITAGTETSTSPETQKFNIHVGKVRMRSQYPNIRNDGKPLILGDSWDGARSSVQKNPRDTNDILSIGGELLTNFVSNSLNDLINEGVANFAKNNLAGMDQAILGNAYSFNPSQILSNLSFNSAQDFLNGFGNANLGFAKSTLPNPQTMGQGGPPERVYSPVSGDEYPKNPGRDLGVPDRVYVVPGGDEYPTNPGGDLGVPDRVYVAPSGDEYPTAPGRDLGVPDRVYVVPIGDEYPTNSGVDLGVPDRVYVAPSGDEYSTAPGVDLGVPDRAYPAPGGDEYATNPGVDLGVPSRSYPSPGGDVYSDNPGPALGSPSRAYPPPSGDVYSNNPGGDLGLPNRSYPDPSGPSVYPDKNLVNVNGELRDPSNTFSVPPNPVYANVQDRSKSRGDIGKVYPPTSGDFQTDKPLNLGNLKPETRYNISTGRFNTSETEFE